MKISFTLKPQNREEVFTQLKQRASKLISATGCGLYQSAADATPVRTGHASASWSCSVGNPLFQSSENSAAPESVFADIQPGAVIYITNSVPYIGFLENGWSVQAPAGISGTAISVCAANFESGVYLS